ncbi:hypothetical protein Bca4012_016760 [Brassica carinata]
MKVVILDPIEDSTESQANKTDSLLALDGLQSSFAGQNSMSFLTTVATVISGLILLSINNRFQRHHIFAAKKWEDEHGDWPSWKLQRIIVYNTRCSSSSRNFSIYLTKGSRSSRLKQNNFQFRYKVFQSKDNGWENVLLDLERIVSK